MSSPKSRTVLPARYAPFFTPLAIITIFLGAFSYVFLFSNFLSTEYLSAAANLPERFIPLPTLNKAEYDARMLALARVSTTTSSTTPRLWPPQTVYPEARAILPFKRVLAYYGNYYSTKMGVLGEYEPETMLEMLRAEKERWEAADPTTPVVPALEYIVTVAQHSPGKDGMYRFRMPDEEIDKTIDLAARIQGIVFLDVQVGLSTLPEELSAIEKYLALPQVHLAIDPEFSMKGGERPGTVIGTFSAADINYAAQYLAELVRQHKLPPKILVVHRFTQNMVTNYEQIQPLPEVQIVMNMDGWGSKELKLGTYRRVIYPEPVQFAGIKIFYKNDLKPPSTGLWTPEEVLSLTPAPIYIQYQ